MEVGLEFGLGMWGGVGLEIGLEMWAGDGVGGGVGEVGWRWGGRLVWW